MLALALAGATAIASGSSFNERFASTLRTFERIYPADQLPLRNAASRKDGYWPFVSRKEEPPQVLTYGEFPLPLFTQLVDRACSAAELGDSQESATLCDIGSGTGRLVLWAAATGRWKAVFGVELFSRIMGIMGIPFMLGMALGPLVGGYVYDQTGTYTLAFVIMLLMFAVCAALLLLVREPARSEAVT